MRILLLSDIHANNVALEAVLKAAPAHDAVWCLGDVVGYGPAPNECIARLRGLNALSLAGNHDLAAVGRVPLEEFSQGARRAMAWTRRVLTPENRAWLETLVPLQTLPEYDLTLVHASPRDPVWDYILTPENALENFLEFSTDLCFFGHTHRPIAYHLDLNDRLLRVVALPTGKPYLLQPELLLNPGSVGQPRDGDPRAAYALYDTDTQQLVHHRAAYDISATQRAILNAGLLQQTAARLAEGA